MDRKIKIMVGSTVLGFENELYQIVALLQTLGYEVLNSHVGTIKVNPKLSNLENCLKAVEECDLFLGIIRPFYGTGNIGDRNITFEEFKKAIELQKPYWFLVHRDVVFARKLWTKIQDSDNIKVLRNNFFDPRCLEVYNYVIRNHVPIRLRNGNWAQEFYRLDEMSIYIKTQFEDKKFIEQILEEGE